MRETVSWLQFVALLRRFWGSALFSVLLIALSRVALRYQIQKLLAADDSLATALAQLVEAVARPTRS